MKYRKIIYYAIGAGIGTTGLGVGIGNGVTGVNGGLGGKLLLVALLMQI